MPLLNFTCTKNGCRLATATKPTKESKPMEKLTEKQTQTATEYIDAIGNIGTITEQQLENLVGSLVIHETKVKAFQRAQSAAEKSKATKTELMQEILLQTCIDRHEESDTFGMLIDGQVDAVREDVAKIVDVIGAAAQSLTNVINEWEETMLKMAADADDADDADDAPADADDAADEVCILDGIPLTEDEKELVRAKRETLAPSENKRRNAQIEKINAIENPVEKSEVIIRRISNEQQKGKRSERAAKKHAEFLLQQTAANVAGN